MLGHSFPTRRSSDLAARANVSSRTLARQFADRLGIGPGRWLLQQRITAARTLLEETDLPVETIAVRVGLSSATNLRRRFRAMVNTTPAAYRRSFGSSRSASGQVGGGVVARGRDAVQEVVEQA